MYLAYEESKFSTFCIKGWERVLNCLEMEEGMNNWVKMCEGRKQKRDACDLKREKE